MEAIASTEGPSALTAEALLSPGRCFGREQLNSKEKGAYMLKEQLWHKQLAKFLAVGISQKEAAELCGVDPSTVADLLRVDWFAARVDEAMKTEGSDILALFKGAAIGAFATLVEITMDKKAPASVRVSGAKEILERHLGKSKQYVEVSASGQSDNPVAEAEALQAELTRLRQDKTLTVLPSASQ
jgi:hypothetical protein